MEKEGERVLTDPDRYPDDDLLLQVLNGAFPAFLEIRKMVSELGMLLEWRYYRDGKSWLAKITCKKKTVIWMSALKGFLQATVYMHVQLLDELKLLPLNQDILSEITAARPSGKLLPCTVQLKDLSRLEDLRQLAEFKLAH